MLEIKGTQINRVEEMNFYTADDAARILHISKTSAYRYIKQMDEKLARKGYITVRGKISARFFEEKFYY